jgi:hypothetical protein
MSNPAGALGPSTFGSGEGSPPQTSPWHWRLEDSDGNTVTSSAGDGQTFPSQSDAESWVGEVWRDLLEDGVDAVRLFEGDREVYGPMSLEAG